MGEAESKRALVCCVAGHINLRHINRRIKLGGGKENDKNGRLFKAGQVGFIKTKVIRRETHPLSFIEPVSGTGH